jgi:antitoxin (DNA-binding transcriptional repressor) of toxin-antitoxin stability system
LAAPIFPLPKVVAEHGYRRAAALIVSRGDGSPNKWVHSERAEKVSADPTRARVANLSAHSQIEPVGAVGEGSQEDILAIAHLLPNGIRKKVGVFDPLYGELDELFGMAHRQRFQHDGVDQAEYGRIGANAESEIGMREFRENLAGYLEGGRPLAITCHGETLGFFIPAQKRNRKAEVEAMRAAAKELDAMIATRAPPKTNLWESTRRSGGRPARRSGMVSSALVLDANILIRAVLGNRVRRILEKYADNVSFYIPESAYLEAEEHLATLVTSVEATLRKG